MASLPPREPDYRFTFANERTFLAWLRTALALIVAGLALTQLPDLTESTWRRLVIGLPPVLAGIALCLSALREWGRAQREMSASGPLPLASRPRTALVVFLALWAIAATVAVISA